MPRRFFAWRFNMREQRKLVGRTKSSLYQTVKREGAHEDSVWGVVWTQDDKLISGSIDETVKVWKANEAAKLEETATFPGNFLGVVSLSASSDGKLCAVSSMDGRLRVLNLDDKVVQRTIDPGPVEAWTVCFHPDGRLIAAGSQSGNVNLFSATAAGDKPEAVFSHHTKFIMAVAYSPDGRHLASGANDGAVHLLNAETGTLIRKLEGHTKAIRSLSFSHDSKTLITASEDMTMMIHDVSAASGNVATLTGHDSWVLSVAQSPAGGECVSGGSDKKVKVWDLNTRTCVRTFTDHSDQVWGVDYNSAGTKFISCGDDGSLVVASKTIQN